MKIALFNCHMRSIPPKKSGGIEKVIDALIKGLVKRGHKLTVFSTGDSKFPDQVEHVSVFPQELEMINIPDEKKFELNKKLTTQLGKILIQRQNEFDIIHNHCLDAGVGIFPYIRNNFVSTIHEMINFETIDRIAAHKYFNYISISYSQRRTFPDLHYVANVYHGIDLSEYPKATNPDDYLVFAGRISEQKTPHYAILAAKRLQKKLYIIGKYKDASQESNYYNNVFLPCYQENRKYVEWIGELQGKELYNFYNKALATLLPVSFREPFGLVGIEAMASGCPVVAFNRGAYPETIEHGRTGYVVEDVEEMVHKLKRIEDIDRDYCRSYVESRFSVDRMVERYIDVYKYIINQYSSIPYRSLRFS